ncbi:hypothetical protein CC78DRAFT_566692 [Lojkania enalia]|uniref:Uncharacterized protein n=1 Tax=Lojkania enalia TaxID=147567 RepID=A0A9P4KDJ9_9PLEO|nr:hypothetical protein CC78DRAFT_566692 [Didymosphaeria enalia]
MSVGLIAGTPAKETTAHDPWRLLISARVGQEQGPLTAASLQEQACGGGRRVASQRAGCWAPGIGAARQLASAARCGRCGRRPAAPSPPRWIVVVMMTMTMPLLDLDLDPDLDLSLNLNLSPSLLALPRPLLTPLMLAGRLPRQTQIATYSHLAKIAHGHAMILPAKTNTRAGQARVPGSDVHTVRRQAGSRKRCASAADGREWHRAAARDQRYQHRPCNR